jgi:FAD/FMN-containing dehydrogenase
MNRRDLIKTAMSIQLLSAPLSSKLAFAASKTAGVSRIRTRVRPGDLGWPSRANWDSLNRDVGGRLLELESPFAKCGGSSVNAACSEALKQIQNPYSIGDQPALTQTSGWVDAWTSLPSVYAVAASTTSDVVCAVNFAGKHKLRLVVKGGGHSYQGTSNAPDSLLIWTRHMNNVVLHNAFVAQGCEGKQAPQPAVTVGAGVMWMDAYDAVTTSGGRYVQGGMCTTVGVAGLVQSGGFNSFSKCYGTGAAGLLEAEVVTADGEVRVANKCLHPDLFWAIKGGGGGTLGVITRLTLRTRELPEFFGAVLCTIKASSDVAYKALIAKAVSFYRSDLFNLHWGEQMRFRRDNVLDITMLFQGLNQQKAESTWAPFFDWVRATAEYSFIKDPIVLSVPARRFWDAPYMQQQIPGAMIADDRVGSSPRHVFWSDDQGEVGQFLHSYKTAWLPASLLQTKRQSVLVDAIFNSTRYWAVALHFNKGLAGAPAEEIAAARNTATNPQALDAFALAFIVGAGPPAYPGMPGPAPDLERARDNAAHIAKAMDALLKAAPGAGAYVSESDYYQANWQTAFWGANYPRLASVKRKYDPNGLFIVHHGVGSEDWSADGFTRFG